MWSKTFWVQVAERAVKTFAQACVALLAGDGLNLLTVDWKHVASVAAVAAVVSVLMSLASKRVGPDDTPSLVRTVPAPPDEVVRILSQPAKISPEFERAVVDAVRNWTRKAGPGWWQ